MAFGLKAIWNLLKDSVIAWIDDKSPRMGAALSFYTAFALPPLFMIAIFIGSRVFNPAEVRSRMFTEIGGLVGQKSAQAIESAMAAQYEDPNKAFFASTVAIITLLVTSTGLFIELQDALNTIWAVEAKPGQGILGFIRIRLMSFAMVVGMAFLLLVSLIVSAALAAVSRYINELTPGLGVISVIANDLVSFIVITVLFAMIFKTLPDVKIAWWDVWPGAAVTSLLFTIGKFLLGWYLGRSTTVSAYGAAGSVVLILLWVYYSAQILFFGAEITKVYALRYGVRMRPATYARWISLPSEEKPGAGPTSPKPSATRPRRIDPDRPLSNEPDRQAELISDLRREVESLRQLVRH